jgi:DNA-binding XRE family transcriptional regulator
MFESRESRAVRIGCKIDQIFKDANIDPSFASAAAFEAMTIKPFDFAEKMLMRRIQEKMARETLASCLGFSLSTLSRWEIGTTSPTLHSASDWAQVLGLDLSIHLTHR